MYVNFAILKETLMCLFFTATVVGQPQLPERTMPPFFIKPVNMSGQGLPGPLGDRLGDKGKIDRFHSKCITHRQGFHIEY